MPKLDLTNIALINFYIGRFCRKKLKWTAKVGSAEKYSLLLGLPVKPMLTRLGEDWL